MGYSPGSSLYYSPQFYKYCSDNKITKRYPRKDLKIWDLWPWQIRRGDTILCSGPQKSKKSYKDNASSTLLKNLDLAEKIYAYVSSTVPHSANFQSRTLKENDEQIYETNYEFFYKGKELSDKVKEAGHGLCTELSVVGKYFSLETFPQEKVETINIISRKFFGYAVGSGTHTMIIIGRDQTSDLGDYKTWGTDAVICDIWAGKYYPLSEVESELYDFKSANYVNMLGFPSPHVRPFNPKSQILVCHNFFG